MHFQYIPYNWLLLISAAAAAGFGIYAWRHRSAAGAIPFALICLTVVVWAVANALEMAGTDLPTKLFWANVQYLCYGALPLAWLALALQHTGHGAWLTRRRLALLAVEPAITVALVWTNDMHGLIRQNVTLDIAGAFPVIGKTQGPWFWVNVTYSYLLFAVSIYLLVAAVGRPAGRKVLYRRQTLTILAGFLLPLVWNVLYNLGLSPVPRHDLAPAVLGLSGVVVGIGLFRFRLFDIGLVARDTVIDSMDDGMIVLDDQDRIVDLNPAAQPLLDLSAAQAIGRPAEEVFSPWPGLVELCHSPAATHIELTLDKQGVPRCYDVHVSPLSGQHSPASGRVGQVILWHDITETKRAQTRLVRQQRVLAGLEERERLAREVHDNLAQVLAFATLQAQAARDLLATGQTAAADTYLARLAEATQDGHADAREYILGAKTTVLPEQGLLPALEHYLRRFGQTFGLDTELVAPEPLDQWSLEPTAEVQLLRIVQEALTNVRKHAHATSVQVSFTIECDQVQIVVEDNGRGFDPARLDEGQAQAFGLRIMRERAEEIEGTLQVLSTPGQGARVVVRVPLHK
jgi:PAS domain S-box-containing protein